MFRLPEIKLDITEKKIGLEVVYFLGEEPIDNGFLLRQAKSLAEKLCLPLPTELKDAAKMLCDAVKVDLLKQVVLNEDFSLKLTVVQGSGCIYTCDVR